MPLQKKLESVRKTKQEYKSLQDRFYQELNNRFPYIMHHDMAKMANDLQENLHCMLCASLKHNSVKIPLPAKNGKENTIVNAQRGETGLYFPGSRRGCSDIHYFDMRYFMKDNGDMWMKYKDSSKKEVTQARVKFSELRKGIHQSRIWPDKLTIYFKILHEVMEHRKQFLCYTKAGRHRKFHTELKVDDLRLLLMEQSFTVKTTDHDQDYYSRDCHGFNYCEESRDMVRLLDYSDPDEEYTFGDNVHYRLKQFIKNYEEICSKLKREEAKKKRAWQTCEGFLDALRVHTVPFHVLNELKR